MKKTMAVLLVAAVTHPSVTGAQQTTPEWDPRGAVWCTYAITALLSEVQKTCLPDFKIAENTLADSLSKHHAFVRRNASETEKTLTAFEARQTDLREASCETLENEGWFSMIKDIEAKPAAYRADIDEILSVDRKPLWNPCL